MRKISKWGGPSRGIRSLGAMGEGPGNLSFVVVVATSSSTPLPPKKKLTFGHLDKNCQKWHQNDSFQGSCFSRNRFFSEKKESTATQEEQGSKRGPFLHICKKTYFFDVDRWIWVEKLVWLIKFSLRVDGTRALSWKDLGFEPRDLGFEKWSKKWSIFFPKNVQNPFPWTRDT